MRFLLTACLCFVIASPASAELTPDIRISSDALGYDLQYRVYVPERAQPDARMPVIFVADGSWYIRPLQMPLTMDRLIDDGRIEPVVAVFVDARDPDDLAVNRRYEQFYCNLDYLRFYTEELIPAIEAAYPVQRTREGRAVLGLSFGGLNAACFGILGWETFSEIGMHSPALHPVRTIVPTYEKFERLPLRIFLSTGWPDDNTAKNRGFAKVLKQKGYDMKFVQTRAGHDWRNWKPLIDDVLLFFYSTDEH
jgi:enterochelin esterase-like enzyme